MKWFRNLKVIYKILLSCFMFIALVIGLVVVNYTTITKSDTAFETFYKDRFIPVRQINSIMKNMLQMRINMLQEIIALEQGNMKEVNERLSYSKELAEDTQKNLDSYLQTYLTSEEKRLSDKLISKIKDTEEIRKQFRSAIHSKDTRTLNKLNEEWLAEYNELLPAIQEILDLQDKVGSQIRNDQHKAGEQSIMIMYIVLAISLLIGVVITLLLLYTIVKPVNKLSFLMKDIAEGEGDLTKRVDVDSNDEIGELGSWFNIFADNIHDIVVQVLVASENLAQAVQQISSGNENLSQRTSEQASSLEEIAATIEESNATTKQNADNALEADKLAKDSSSLAEDGGLIVKETISSINDISDSSTRIGNITSMIDEIAFQTNLLSLNAAVEAARAGEQGRGFAVVAGEVRNLAQRAGNAAKEISDLISDSVGKIARGNELVNKSGESLNEIIDSIKKVSQIVGEISAASEEQRRGIQQINTAVTDLDTMTQQNAALVEETASASEEMTNQAQELLGMMSRFTVNEKLKNQMYQQNRKEMHLQTSGNTANAGLHKIKSDSGNGNGTGNKMKTEGSHDTAVNDVLLSDGFEEF